MQFQRTARRDKETFFSDHCKEKDENNRMGKTKDLFKKIRDTKGTFHAKMGSIKDQSKDTLPSPQAGKLTSLVPHKRLPEYPIIPREKTHSGAAVREKPQDAPVKERWGPSFPA